MSNISLNQYGRLLGSRSVIGIAGKLGVGPPPPPISVRHLLDLAGQVILPLAPVGLQPQNGASGISSGTNLFFTDPGDGTPAAALQFEFLLSQNGIVLNSPPLTGDVAIASPLIPPGTKWPFPLPPGQILMKVWGTNKAGRGPASTSTFTVASVPVVKPHISVAYTPPPASAKFNIKGTNFLKNHVVHIRGVNDADPQHPAFADTTSDSSGAIDFTVNIPCQPGTQLSFSANDERPDPGDVTGTLFSNTVTVTAA